MDHSSITCECGGYCFTEGVGGYCAGKGIEPGKEVVEKADQEGIPLLGTMDDTFTISGKLFQLLR